MAQTKRRNSLLAIAGGALLLVGLWLWWPSPALNPRKAPEPAATKPPSPAESHAPPGRDTAAASSQPSAPTPVLRLLPARRTEAPEGALGAFAGRVVSATTGRGIPGAELTFAGPSGATSARTGEDGAFRFTPEREGVWQLASVRAGGFLPFGPEWGQSPIRLTARPRVGVDGLLLALSPEEAWTVRVEDAEGKPLAKAEVRLLTGRAGETVLYPVEDRFVTGADGEVRVLAPEDSQVEARHPGHAPARETLGPRLVDRRAVLRLKATARKAGEVLAGRVVDESGAGLAGARVLATRVREGRPLPRQDAPPGVEAVTDEEGRFVLEGLESERYDVFASVLGRKPATAKGLAAGRRDVVLVLATGARLTGRVRDMTGQPVASFRLGLERHVGVLEREFGETATVVDPEGRFALEGLSPGRYTLQVAAHGLSPAAPVVEVGEGVREVGPLEVMLALGARLEGRVVRAGTEQPVPRARVSVEGGLYGGTLDTVYDALSDESGHFVVEGLAPGKASLSVSAEGYHTRIEGVEAAAGAPVSVRVELQPTAEGEAPQVEMMGIGAVLAARDDALVLGQLFPGGGALEAGLREGDAIVRIDGKTVVELGGLGPSVQLIRGPEGSRVLLGIRRAGSTEVTDVWVVRRKVKV